ncbi:hypothetical protein B1C78_10905 [Thioalkalivibrio denitrificans]|uniref:DUF1499 domain-containing protein n=1 Tax=Thioalkalivibrio denitrificans TaxID=108003 RepID=A0A1V3NF15_9GAMM|nr:DUF1499 domain-containing protein [Thioalkalivibrio denitrificans]OOG23625.1 hypothetical protein B1C78_10905 [Thioalkalivibrio denitrificans]
MKMLWWLVPLALVLGAVFVLGRWPMINDVLTGHTPEYPDIQPQHLRAEPGAVFEAALTVARDAGWEIVETDAAKGRIEAVATTRFLRFRDDVTILIEPAGQGGSRVDIRSRSRVGRSDLGANARRIRSFQEKLLKLQT